MAGRRARKPRIVDDEPAAPPSDDQTFMDEQRAADEQEGRFGQASKSVKQCAAFSTEAARRLAAARTITTTPDALLHDLERIRVCAHAMIEHADEALSHLQR